MKPYTPPPKFKDQNIDRGFVKKSKKEEKPKSNQFPTTKAPRDYSNIRTPYND